jgi:histidinol-phosphate aminotransferase
VKFNDVLKQIKTYEAGKPIELVVREFGVAPEDVVKLASNENPLGTSPRVQEVLRAHADKAHLYPDDSMYELKAALKKRFGVEENRIIIGAGSDQVLEFVSRALLNETTSVLMSRVTFAMYEIYAKQQGAKIVRTPSYEHSVEEFLQAYAQHRPRVVYICTPNNPTGDATSREDVLRIIEGVDAEETLVVVDGAYMEYAAARDARYRITPADLAPYAHVLYLGTFSKAYGLGGMRVGYGIGHPDVISALYKMRPPFNITTLSLAAAVAACEDEAFVEKSIALHFKELARYEAFAQAHGFTYIDSYTNFITYLFDEKTNASDIAGKLLRQGVIVRDLASYGMNALRITVGTPEQNDVLFSKLDAILRDIK